jgi:hypothetical protein
LKPAELKALAEAVSTEIEHNPHLAARIVELLAELKPVPKIHKPKPKFKSPNDELNKLKRQNKVDNLRFNPYTSLDPFTIYEMVGKEQLASALSSLSVPTLKQMLATLPNTGTGKPGSKTNKEQVVEYIVRQVVKN